MQIRQLNAEDAEQYLELRLGSLKNNPEAFSASFEEEKERPLEVYTKRLQSQEISSTYGAFVDSKLVGMVTLLLEDKLKLKHRATIVSMYVIPEIRGNGIGKSLLKESIEKAEAIPEVEQVYLTVASLNQSAKKLYRNAGFKKYGIEEKALKYKGNYFDIDHMVLFLEGGNR
ncbi:GNAT family N-acetyltransferase [Virgibacillus kekensis]|uniref:GNAT family N-acetyltransferase n=1 Tax=Virgibacillus kekensis TaxID=202261 RepID=A0ABV9DNV9_9BACI